MRVASNKIYRNLYKARGANRLSYFDELFNEHIDSFSQNPGLYDLGSTMISQNHRHSSEPL